MKYWLWYVVCFLCCSCAQKSRDTEEEHQVQTVISSEPEIDSAFSTTLQQELGELEEKLISAGLVNVATVIPEVFVSLKYSTTDNFFGKDVYGDLENCYVQPEVISMLKTALETLWVEHPDLTFLVYDGVRPRSVQQLLWDSLDKPDSIKPLYVADPQKGSLHNYGVAIDLTLANRKTGEALDLGTPYDYFGFLAYPDREAQMLQEGKIQPVHVERRQVLRDAMKAAGFSGIGSEWWHFNAYGLEEAKKRYEIVP